MKKEQDSTIHPKQRTPSQNNALWLFYSRLADALNDMGLDMRKILKPTYNIPWTKENVHDHIWIPFQKAMYGTNSTTFLPKQEQIDKLHTTIMRELGEKHSVEFIPFPTSEEDKQTAPLRDEDEPLRQRIEDYIRMQKKFVNGGEVERFAMDLGYKASNASRRCREMESGLLSDGKTCPIVLEKEERNGTVWYRYITDEPKVEEKPIVKKPQIITKENGEVVAVV